MSQDVFKAKNFTSSEDEPNFTRIFRVVKISKKLVTVRKALEKKVMLQGLIQILAIMLKRRCGRIGIYFHYPMLV